jgi:hypothetical protein
MGGAPSTVHCPNGVLNIVKIVVYFFFFFDFVCDDLVQDGTKMEI